MLGTLLVLLIHWSGAPGPMAHWYASQHNKNGQFCCSEADGHDFYGAYTTNPDGSVEFDVNGVHHKLPAYMILDGPNPTGHAVWWYGVDWNHNLVSYCFALGPGL